uniref:Uncharacterized protein n=1 Tax=Setaria digitata TaxID=48799 RepID=A0A915Q326_9BILA
MGIQGLWQILEPVAEPITLESLEGKRLAIDISIWLHQAAHGYTEHQLNSKHPHLSLVLKRLGKLLFYKIRPLFVFDGPNVPIFKKKLLRDRQVKRYVEELTMTKAQKRILQQLASSQLLNYLGGEQQVNELSEIFALQSKKRRDNDLFDVSMPSTSKSEPTEENVLNNDESAIIYSSFESSRSSEFDQTEFDSLATRDERVDYLLAARDKVRSGLKLREVPSDSKAFSNLQIDRLLKRNRINEQLQLVKNEALKRRVFSTDGKRTCSSGNIRLAAMEGLDRMHIITDDSEVQIIDEEKEAKKKDLMDSLTWPLFLEKIKDEKGDKNTEEAGSSNAIKGEVFYGDDDDDDDALQEAIHASLLENEAREIDRFQTAVDSYAYETKGDMVERLRTAFSERDKDLHHDTWSSSESSDEFVEVPVELSEHTFEKGRSPSSTLEISSEYELRKCLIKDNEHMNETGKNINEPHDESAVEGLSTRINPVEAIDLFASTQEEGIYKDCQDLLRICGIPFVVAPGEAEAQCCELERLGLVQGIISDDSDVWLFGAAVVYKNMFNQKRRLQMYSIKTIQNHLGLSRWETIQIALLSGGDYTNGLEGVGVVSALELVSEFANALRQIDAEPSQQAFENLQRISAWLNHRGILGEQQDMKAEKFTENTRRLKLRRLIEKNNVTETLEAFPSREIFNAYAKPLVDNSTEKPKWRKIEMEQLESFVWEKLGWDSRHLKEQTNHSLLKWNEYLNPAAGGSGQSYQMHITSFAHRLQKSEDDQRLFLTARVQNALQRLVTIKNSRNQTLPENVGKDFTAEVKTISKRKRLSKSTVEKSTRGKREPTNVSTNKRKKLTETKNAKNTSITKDLQLSEESSDSDIY